MMPFIVTTKNRYNGANDLGYWATRSRRAVATLKEARTAMAERIGPCLEDNTDPSIVAIANTDESGGTVGPLPDGTVIKVKPVTWDTIRVEIGAVGRRGSTHDPAMIVRADDLLAAFNVREVVREDAE